LLAAGQLIAHCGATFCADARFTRSHAESFTRMVSKYANKPPLTPQRRAELNSKLTKQLGKDGPELARLARAYVASLPANVREWTATVLRNSEMNYDARAIHILANTARARGPK
jgi:hypothetical protein